MYEVNGEGDMNNCGDDEYVDKSSFAQNRLYLIHSYLHRIAICMIGQ